MKEIIVTIYTNDNNSWLLNGFQYLFKKYWSLQKARIVGYTLPDNKTLSNNFPFHSIDKRNYAIDEWSTGIILSLDKFIADGEEFFIMMLEDYWLIESVKQEDIKVLTKYINEQPHNILRIDLTTDRRQHRRFIIDTDTAGHCKLIRTSANSPYQMSFQAAIWNIKLFKEILRPHENPWQSEIEGSKRLARAGDKYIVLGATNHPVKYRPVYRSKKNTVDISKLTKKDQNIIRKKGWTNGLSL